MTKIRCHPLTLSRRLCYAKLPDDPARIAGGDDVRGQAADDDAARADHCVLPNRDAGADDHAAAQPDAVADRYRQCILDAGAPLLGINRVRGRVNSN